MQKYIGTKVINAVPMTRLEYNQLRGWQLPEDENGADEGFLVEYVDGGKANHPGFTGYISWSPKDVFERAYKLAETHIDRMLIESAELKEKCQKLFYFLSSDKFKELSDLEQGMLVTQHAHMQQYRMILDARIAIAQK